MRSGRLLALVAVLPSLVGFAPHAAEGAAEGAGEGAGRRSSVEFRFADPAIVESSGLVSREGLFVTVNDSGDTGRVFTVDPADGRTVGVTTWTTDGRAPEDVEALAPMLDRSDRGGAGHGAVWVGDIGDNLAVRDSVTVVRVPFGRGDRTVTPTSYELTYPGGASDAETLLVDPDGRLLVVTKGLFGAQVMIAPKTLDAHAPNRLRRLGVALAYATDGAFFPDGRHLIVRGYSSAAVYTYPDLVEVGYVELPAQPQGEGIAVDEDGAVFVSTEGARSRVLRVRLPAAIAEAVAPVRIVPAMPSTPSTPAAPSTHGSPPGSPQATGGPAQGAGADVAPGGASRWPWALGGLLGLGALVLVRSLRRP